MLMSFISAVVNVDDQGSIPSKGRDGPNVLVNEDFQYYVTPCKTHCLPANILSV
jgi:hypothetical protein